MAEISSRGEQDVAAQGDPARRFMRGNIGALIEPKDRFEYLALYDMNSPPGAAAPRFSDA